MTFQTTPWQVGPTQADLERHQRTDERYDTGRTIHAALDHQRPPWWRPLARRTWHRADYAVHRALMARTQAAYEHHSAALPHTWVAEFARALQERGR